MKTVKDKYRYLFSINSPSDLKKLSVNQLPDLCDEIRTFLIETITKTGGHFGAGLGVVELTVALHYVYDTPKDKIIFDVGHQGYPHKILTGRRDLLHTIRKKDGLSGFLKPAESEYDAFGAGHASTSISAALGMATARDLLGQDYKVVAVIGDGAMTGGLAFEGMNNCGVQKRDICVILNDNNYSIDTNVSALSNYFNELFASYTMQKMRENVWKITGKMDYFGDRIRKLVSRLEGGIKAVVTPGILFEAMGFNYFGPINGHNVRQLVKILKLIREIHGPVFLHVITNKGKGYEPAEKDIYHLHSIEKIEVNENGNNGNNQQKPPKYQKVFGDAIIELAQKDPKIVAITAAMAEGTGLDEFAKTFPDRFFDVGIAESHAVTFASGLAMQGITPVCAIYSTFLQRAYDQIVHDCCLQNLHVIFAIDRAGLVGADGATHHGVLDIVFLRTIPNMTLCAPKDEQELRDLLYSAIYYYNGPVAIRYPKGRGMGVSTFSFNKIPYGKWEVLKEGQDLVILAVGKMVSYAIKSAEILEREGISVSVVNARFIKPLDYSLLDVIAQKFSSILTVEDGQKLGGFGSAVLEYLNTIDYKGDIIIHGIPDNFIEHGTQEELYKMLQLESEGIAEKALESIREKINNL